MKKNIRKKMNGLTLIEMMMSITIFSMGIAGFTMLFSKTWKTNSYVLEMGQSSMNASQGVNKIVDYIRRVKQADDGAYPVKSADSNDLVLFSDYDKDGATERLHFYKSGSNILMGVTNPTTTLPKTYPTNDQEIITLVSNVVNEIDEPIFYYYNKDYPGDTTNNPLTMPVTNHLADIRLMKIFLQVNTNPNKFPSNIKIQSFVEMRNLNDYDRVQ
ncbi:MAG: hypothetical protein US30_C0003G0041 [Candidatus Moranbacteria bacterium GW2011_GWF2_36_839]|nr:MAG: hypothetical protein US27_C0004G0041 [Candidatus Moranbacteria bacterium GW2011_GWF1_36_78]KKQ17474.1 MAG: hypothetical protein US30_C0003G0041 [Candidatus Moranbacteria bacterium GW2011_GWF2_36_839]HAT73941.1 hypothetical protein [Candidatus Moranbacteria bacterium]HBY10533.1 hypothetical protein [Candidatus Moranbacteria bacterium]